MKKPIRLSILTGLIAITTCIAQEEKNFMNDDVNYHVQDYWQLTIRASEPRSPNAPKSFVLDDFELKTGNAAIFYYRACLRWQTKSQAIRQKLSDNWARWFESKLKDLPTDEVAEFLSQFADVLEEFEKATSRKSCEWGWDMEQMEYTEFVSQDVSELHTFRTIARLNRLKTRLQIARGEFKAAHESITRGFKLAHDVGQSIVVGGIIAESLAGISLDSVLELSQTASHNNFAALQSLPKPIVDYPRLLRTELDMFERTFKILQNPATTSRSPDQWRELFLEAMKQCDSISELSDSSKTGAEDRLSRTGVLLAQLYPVAKRELIRDGWDQAEIEIMPVAQVVAIQTRRVWDENKASLEGFHNLPAGEATQLAKERAKLNREQGYNQPSVRGDFPLTLFTGSPNPIFVAIGNRTVNRQIAIMQSLEQIRDFASQQQRLPTSEEFIEFSRVRDSSTNKRFDYQPESDSKAILQTLPEFFKNDSKWAGVRFRMDLTLEN